MLLEAVCKMIRLGKIVTLIKQGIPLNVFCEKIKWFKSLK